MKRTIFMIIALIAVQTAFTACGTTDTPSAAVPAKSSNEIITESQNTETVLIKINTEGWGGQIAFTDDGSKPVFNDEYPAQSAAVNTQKGTELILSAKTDSSISEDISFVNWKKNGTVFSDEPVITVTADEDCEYVAVFMSGRGNSVDLESVTTLGELLDLRSWGSSCMDGTYVQVFEQDGIYYRAIADIDETTSQAFFELSYDDEDYDEKCNELLSPLTVNKIENISAAIPPQEELDELIGKTGEDLLNDEWISFSFDSVSMESYMQHGLFAYIVVFEGDIQAYGEYSDDVIKPLTVKSVKYEGLGDPADLNNRIE